jgi:hypothetical protein
MEITSARMEHTRIPLQAYKYQPSGKRDIDRPRRRRRETQHQRPKQEILLVYEVMMMMNINEIYIM